MTEVKCVGARRTDVKGLLLRIGLCALGTVLSQGAAHAETERDSQLWLSTTATGQISDEFFYTTQVQTRFVNDMRFNAQNIVLPPIIGYRVTRNLSVSLGYGYTDLPQERGPNEHENRLMEEIGYRVGKVGPGMLDTYVRLEQRFRSDGNSTAWRVRSRIRYKIPLQDARKDKQAITAVVAIEPMFYLNTADWGPRKGFDQFRTYIGGELPLSRKLRIDVGYTNMMFNGGATNQLNHIAAVGLVLKL